MHLCRAELIQVWIKKAQIEDDDVSAHGDDGVRVN